MGGICVAVSLVFKESAHTLFFLIKDNLISGPHGLAGRRGTSLLSRPVFVSCSTLFSH